MNKTKKAEAEMIAAMLECRFARDDNAADRALARWNRALHALSELADTASEAANPAFVRAAVRLAGLESAVCDAHNTALSGMARDRARLATLERRWQRAKDQLDGMLEAAERCAA